MSGRIVITGGAGFIGSALVRHLVQESDYAVINVDKLTYAGNLEAVASVANDRRYQFEQADICNTERMLQIMRHYHPSGIVHLAAESHVDRSIDGPSLFIKTNIVGTYSLLEAARIYWQELRDDERHAFRFLHVSTDEVYGSLGPTGLFSEQSCYRPSSPYAASKAAADHLAGAWWRTYGLPVIVSNCSNNFGEYQYPEKLIPLMILNAIEGRELPMYGRGDNIRDWLYVGDHVVGLRLILERGRAGETYNVGGSSERSNIEVVRTLCGILDEQVPATNGRPYEALISFVEDRPGHDKRYAIDAGKLVGELGWAPQDSFESGLRRTVAWYLENRAWCEAVQGDRYQRERLGLGEDPR